MAVGVGGHVVAPRIRRRVRHIGGHAMTIISFPQGAPSCSMPAPITATWTYSAFSRAVSEIAPTLPRAERAALYDKFRVATETAMRMAAEQMAVTAVMTLCDVANAGTDVWDWFVDDGSPAVGNPVVRK